MVIIDSAIFLTLDEFYANNEISENVRFAMYKMKIERIDKFAEILVQKWKFQT